MFFKALYFALEQTNVGDFCFRPKQIEILLNVWRGNNVVGLLPTGYGKSLVFYLIPDLMFYKSRARDTARSRSGSMNMTVDFDRDALTDPTLEDTTAKAVLVVSPLNALISDQMERLKSLDLPMYFNSKSKNLFILA